MSSPNYKGITVERLLTVETRRRAEPEIWPIFMVPNFITLLCLKFMFSNEATPLICITARLSGPSGQSAPLMWSFSMLVAGPGQVHTKVSMHND